MTICSLAFDAKTPIACGHDVIDMTWLETAPLPDLMARRRKERDDAFGRNDLLFAQGVHPADEAVP